MFICSYMNQKNGGMNLEKDINTRELINCNDVFADIINANLQPQEKIRAEDLQEMDTELSYKDEEGNPHKLFRDTLKKIDKLGGYVGFIGFEAQTGINNAMPIRTMGYDYTRYKEQVQEIVAENAKNQKPAYAKEIHDDQRVLPVATIALYFGKKPWERPLALKDIMDIPPGQEAFWDEIVNDYKIKVIHMRHQPKEIRERYESDYRLIAEYLDCYDKGKEEMRKMLKENQQKLIHREQTLDMLRALNKDRRLGIMKERYEDKEYEEEQEERDALSEYLDELEERGMERGMKRGREELIGNMLRKKQTPEFISEMTDLPLSYVYEVERELNCCLEEPEREYRASSGRVEK